MEVDLASYDHVIVAFSAGKAISSQDVKGVFKWLERLDLDGYRRSGRED